MSLDYDFNASDLDEFLVEYVDGTMDPVVREAFEEFLRVYPEVAEQVDCLSTVRSQLCRLGDNCRCQAPPGFQDRLKEQLLEETSKDEAVTTEIWAPHLNSFALAFSLTLLALAVGLSATAPSQEPSEAVAIEISDDTRPTFDGPTIAPPSPAQRFDLQRSVTFRRDSYWNVSHTHPGSREVHVEAAFEQPVLLSVRRDIVALRPVSVRRPLAYTLP